jgi:hypothetical protein
LLRTYYMHDLRLCAAFCLCSIVYIWKICLLVT